MRFNARVSLAAAGLSVAWLAAIHAAQSPTFPADLDAYFTKYVKLEPNARAQLQAGAPVTKMLDSDPSKEVAVFGAVWVNAPVERYLAAVRDIERARARSAPRAWILVRHREPQSLRRAERLRGTRDPRQGPGRSRERDGRAVTRDQEQARSKIGSSLTARGQVANSSLAPVPSGPATATPRYALSFVMPTIRDASLADLPALTDILNHYIVHTPINFDVEPYTVDARRHWFDEHGPHGRYRLLVAEEAGQIVGYATTSQWRPKASYGTTVESSIYCRHDACGRGIGSALYLALFDAIKNEDIHMIVAGATMPNAASRALHERLGFREVGVFKAVGRKFGQFWDVAWFQRALKM